MGKIIILPETTRDPISLIGRRAGVCWGGNIEDPKKNYQRGLDCIKSGHGRTWEFVNVEMVLEGYSARVIREWYTHIGGSPTRLQASTRYIDYGDFDYVTPRSIAKDPEKAAAYDAAMRDISEAYQHLQDAGVPKEDIANLLPVGMTTRVVDKRNLRNLTDMSHQRMCARAYWEYRELFRDVCDALREVSDEWAWVVGNMFKPKCEVTGFCTEARSCGRMPKKDGE